MATSILHVLPHAGGGGETYLRQLSAMEGVRFERFALTERRRSREVPGGLIRLGRALPRHDLIHVHGDSAALSCWPLIGRIPTVITLHGSHLLRRSRKLGGVATRAASRRVFARADAVIAVSESELAFVREIAPRAAGRIELIRNGVPRLDPPRESDRRRIRAELRLGESSIAALFVGELSDRKQPIEFAQGVRSARDDDPRIVGLLAGDGPLRGAIESMADEHLRFLGARDDVTELLAAADVFVLPSRWEGLSYAVLEAMALGRAILVSDGPGNVDAVGNAGLVFPVGDVAAMAKALSRLAGDPGFRASLGEAAASRARERFTVSGMIAAMARVYERALEGRPDR